MIKAVLLPYRVDRTVGAIENPIGSTQLKAGDSFTSIRNCK